MKTPMRDIKTTPPSISPHIVNRSRLLKEIFGFKRHLVLSAGPGWGKTTLLSSFVHSYDIHYLWYNIDKNDQDQAEFLSNLSKKISEMFPEQGHAIAETYKDILQGNSGWHTLCRELLNAIYNSDHDHFYLIFDDFHHIAQSDSLRGILLQILERAPLNLHCIISSRENPEIPLSKLLSSGEIIRFSEHNLGFDEPDIKEYFQLNYSADLNFDKIISINNFIEGWPAGLRLIGDAPIIDKGKLGPFRFSKLRNEGGTVYDYFYEQIFEDLPDHIKDFILKTSILDSFTHSLCASVFGSKTANTGISYLVNKNCFIKKTEADEIVYEYHALFQQFLLTCYHKIAEKGDIIKQHNTFADYYMKQGRFKDAFNHCIQSKDMHRATIILEKSIDEHFSKGTAENLLLHMEQIPLEYINKNPRLLYAKGWAEYSVGKWNDAVGSLEMAMTTADKQNLDNIFGNSVLHFIFMQFLLDNHDKVVQLVEENSEFISDDSREYVEINALRARSLMQSGLPQQAGYWWDVIQSKPLVQTNYDVYAKSVLIMGLDYYAVLGLFDDAIFLINKAVQYFRESDYQGYYSRFLMNLGFIKYEMGYFAESEKIFSQSLEEMKIKGQLFPQPIVLSFIAINSLHMQKIEQASEYVEQAQEILSNVHSAVLWKNSFLSLAKALLAYHQNRREEFFKEAEKAIQAVNEKNLVDAYTVFSNIGICYSYFGRPEKEIQLLNHILKTIRTLDKSYIEARTRLLLASALFEQGNLDKVQDHLNKAIDISVARNYDFLFLNKEPEIAVKLLPLALKQGMHLEFATKILISLHNNKINAIFPILKKSNNRQKIAIIEILGDLKIRDAEKMLSDLEKNPDKEVAYAAARANRLIQSLPPQLLKIKALGRFKVWRGEKEIPESSWTRKISKSLVMYFVFHENMSINTEILQDLFFPDADPKRSVVSIHQGITSLRKALEPGISPKRTSSYIKSEKGAYRFLLPEGSYVDTFEFETLCDEADRAGKNNDQAQALSKYLSAIALYDGDLFEEDLYVEWMEPLKSRVYLCYTRALYEAGKMLYKKNDFERCIKLLNLLLHKEPWHENACRLLIESYSALGDRARAVSAYLHYEKAVEQELGVEPSKSLKALYDRLIRD